MPGNPFFGDGGDDQVANSGTPAELLKKRMVGPMPFFASSAPTVPANTSVDPSTIPQPDIGQPSAMPGLDQFRALIAGNRAQPVRPTQTKGQKLVGLIQAGAAGLAGQGLPGSVAASYGQTPPEPMTTGQKIAMGIGAAAGGVLRGRAAQEQMIAATGGRRAGGVGVGFEAGEAGPAQQAATLQSLQRGGLENTILGAQAQYAAPMAQLNFGKTYAAMQKDLADAGKASAETAAIPMKAALEKAQTLAARYKEDPGSGQLIDLQSGQPFGNTTGLAPLSADEAAVLGKQEGDRVPIKLKNTASEIVNRGIKSVSAGGRQLLVDGQGNTIKDLGQATPLSVVNATMGAFANPASPEVQALVHQVGQGKVDLPTALSSMRRNPAAAASFMGALFQQYPDYNQANFGVSKRTMDYFTTGKGAEQLTAFRTAISHADLLAEAAKALQNGDTRALNTIKNTLKTQFGDPEPTNFNVIANAYTREVTKAVSAGHITNDEIQTQGATMPQNASPSQIAGATEAYKALMASKAQQLMLQYEQGLQAKPAFPGETTPGNAPKAPTFADWQANKGKK